MPQATGDPAGRDLHPLVAPPAPLILSWSHLHSPLQESPLVRWGNRGLRTDSAQASSYQEAPGPVPVFSPTGAQRSSLHPSVVLSRAPEAGTQADPGSPEEANRTTRGGVAR